MSQSERKIGDRLATLVWRDLFSLLLILRRNRTLALEMIRREIYEPHAGQVLGALWVLGHPLFMMALYVVVFGFVFKTKVSVSHEMPLDYTTYILAGLIPWLAFHQSLGKSSTALTSQSNLVKQVVFPIEIIPLKGVVSCFVPQFFATTLFLLYVFFSSGAPAPTIMFLPVLVVFQFLGMLGCAYLLAAVGVYFRDIKEIVQILLMAGVYLMPIFYLPDWVPTMLRPLIYLNPFSYMIWCYQDALYFGYLAHPLSWVIFPSLSTVMLILGYGLFRQLKPYFGNVL